MCYVKFEFNERITGTTQVKKMKIDNPNLLFEHGSALKAIEIKNGEIILETKNGASLTITPNFNPISEEMGFELNLLSSKENKAITKNLKKIEELRKEIEATMSGGVIAADDEDSQTSQDPLDDDTYPYNENEFLEEDPEEIGEEN